MNATLRTLARGVLFPVLLSLGAGGLACVGASEARSPWSGWTTLRLKAKSVPLMRGHVELRLADVGEGRRLETSTSARFFGATIARSETTTMLDSVTGRAKAYDSYSKKKGRRYRFADRSYSVEKLRRSSSGDTADGWDVTSVKQFDYPVDPDDVPRRPFDYYGMLLNLREFGLDKPGDEVTVYVATSGGPQAYRIRVSEARSAERTFEDLDSGDETTLACREFRLSVAPADAEAEGGFLNMEGEVEIWVEADTKTLLEIVGKVPRVPGRVRLELSALGWSGSGPDPS